MPWCRWTPAPSSTQVAARWDCLGRSCFHCHLNNFGCCGLTSLVFCSDFLLSPRLAAQTGLFNPNQHPRMLIGLEGKLKHTLVMSLATAWARFSQGGTTKTLHPVACSRGLTRGGGGGGPHQDSHGRARAGGGVHLSQGARSELVWGLYID